jgi:hypothetical protein
MWTTVSGQNEKEKKRQEGNKLMFSQQEKPAKHLLLWLTKRSKTKRTTLKQNKIWKSISKMNQISKTNMVKIGQRSVGQRSLSNKYE